MSTSAQPPGARLSGLAPLINPHTRILILGSFPGAASLAAQQYYGHPRNDFWRLVMKSAGWPDEYLTYSYEIRSQQLLDHGLGLWDVYAACERQGSLDSAIRNAQPNDLSSLRMACPQLQLIAHNGGESYRHRRYTEALGLPVHRLPSSSPANASWSFERKLKVWREVLATLFPSAPTR